MPDLTSLNLNKYQTPLTRELLQSQPEIVVNWLEDAIFNHEFIRNLISADRPYAKDAERDQYGRAILDITNPYIVEDVDYFRQSVIGFEKTGKYCLEKPSKNRNSPYQRFWMREIFRCWDGMVRPEDGAWVTGLEYFFLNYYRMEINFVQKGSKKAIRKTGCPRYHEAIHYRYNYKYFAREAGKHAIELSKRGSGKSHCIASDMSHNLILGENWESKENVSNCLVAADESYLNTKDDGTFKKFENELTFLRDHTPFPRSLLTKSSGEMSWMMGWKDKEGNPHGSKNIVFGATVANSSDKMRGKRGFMHYEEMGNFPNLLDTYAASRRNCEDGDFAFAMMNLVGCVCDGTKVWTNDGRFLNIEDLKVEDGIVGFAGKNKYFDENLDRGSVKNNIEDKINIGYKDCVEIELANGNRLCCSVDHPIYVQKYHCNHDSTIKYFEEQWKFAGDLKVGDRVIELRKVDAFGTKTLFDARLVGMLIGDGTYGSCVRYSSEDDELWSYIESKYEASDEVHHITKKGRYYREGYIKGVRKKLQEIGILGQTGLNKRLPELYQQLDRENTILLLSGLYDTDGTISIGKEAFLEISSINKEIIEGIKILWRKFGVIGSIHERKPNPQRNPKDKNICYTLTISGRRSFEVVTNTLKLLVKRKSEKLEECRKFYECRPKEFRRFPEDIIVSKVKSVKHIGKHRVYNMSAGVSHTYLANNIITHNTANNKDSNFEGAKTLLYEPDENNLYSVPNLYDDPSKGKSRFGLFTPSYLNRLNCDNEDGITDVVKALIQIMTARYKAKNSSDPKVILRVIAEDPIDPAEAMITVRKAYFPTAALQEQLTYLNTHPSVLDESLKGTLVMNNSGEVVFKPTNDEPLRKWNRSKTEKDGANIKGALEIFAPPQKSTRTGKIQQDRYIIGCDPVDQESAESSSLFCVIVFDRMTNSIVAEYTGRHDRSDDNYELVRLLCYYYNARCLYENNIHGLQEYFRQYNCTHLLAEAPEYLKSLEKIHYTAKGAVQRGVRATKPINDYANDLIRNWLIEPLEMAIEDQEGNETVIQKRALNTIMSPAILEELIGYFPEANVDRIRALGMVMLYRESFKQEGHDLIGVEEDFLDKGYLGNSSFFDGKASKKRSRKDMSLSSI